ncbi:uncharacterized protein LOC131663254 [Phymastichus coffea]|uniref:uncharacterized protein LOC131663254 n=1 Tax=Phymastichus coffea TaxID=108790 RepID=UPI00273C7B86|nr:uncharacterized protein LOC131663254 [Phymastichus coffea]
MLFLNRLKLSIFKIILIELVVAFPDKYEIQDADTNMKIDLMDILNNYTDNAKGHQRDSNKNDLVENWTGRWLPSRPGEYTPPPKVFHKEIYPHNENVQMGVKNVKCDDGKTNLTVDWDHSLTSYTCFGKKIVPDMSIIPEYYCEIIPKNYKAIHKCMNNKIEYTEDIPTFGTHRPIWPVYGEYKYVPTQRWLHSLEHGAVVMLYHPCANSLEIERLKKLVKGCLRRYIISPNNLLDEQRPLALLTWGCKLTMSHVDEEMAKQFIQDNALHGPEEILFDGSFKDQLIEKSKVVSDMSDSMLCSLPM